MNGIICDDEPVCTQTLQQAVRDEKREIGTLEGYSDMYGHMLNGYRVVYDSADRAAGLLCGQKLLSLCDEVWVLPDGEPTEGMQREIEYARLIRKPVRYFNMMIDEEDEDGGSVE